jgi:hypothetical protein
MKFMEVESKGEVFHRSPAMHWEIFPTRHSDAVIHRVRSFGGTIFFVTDRSGRNFKHCSDMEDCYRIIEETFPWVMLDGTRSEGTIEILRKSSALTAPV